MQGFQQPGAPPSHSYNVPLPRMPAGPSGPGGQLPGSYLQTPYGQPPQQPVAPAIPGVQSTSLYLGFEAAPDFNVAQRLKGPSECDEPISAASHLQGSKGHHFQAQITTLKTFPCRCSLELCADVFAGEFES